MKENKILCPFRKFSYYNAGRNTGNGYPELWEVYETFEKCILNECALYNKTEDKCSLCS